jgi:hypothetical protein
MAEVRIIFDLLTYILGCDALCSGNSNAYCLLLDGECLAYSSTLKMESVLSYETLTNFYWSTCYYISEEYTIQ